MTILFSDIKKAVKRHLAIIGKRLYSKEGKNLFSDITTSSKEDDIFDDYIEMGSHNIATALHQMLLDFSVESGDKMSISIQNLRVEQLETNPGRPPEYQENWNFNIYDDQCNRMISSYLIYFTLGEYLSMIHPDLATKYIQGAISFLQTLIAFVFHKDPPVNGISFSNPTGTVDDSEDPVEVDDDVIPPSFIMNIGDIVTISEVGASEDITYYPPRDRHGARYDLDDIRVMTSDSSVVKATKNSGNGWGNDTIHLVGVSIGSASVTVFSNRYPIINVTFTVAVDGINWNTSG